MEDLFWTHLGLSECIVYNGSLGLVKLWMVRGWEIWNGKMWGGERDFGSADALTERSVFDDVSTQYAEVFVVTEKADGRATASFTQGERQRFQQWDYILIFDHCSFSLSSILHSKHCHVVSHLVVLNRPTPHLSTKRALRVAVVWVWVRIRILTHTVLVLAPQHRKRKSFRELCCSPAQVEEWHNQLLFLSSRV